MTNEQMDKRQRDLWPLNNAIDNDAVVNRIGKAYIIGEIATLEEALFQIAIRCASAKKMYADELMHMKTYAPSVIQPENIRPNSCT